MIISALLDMRCTRPTNEGPQDNHFSVQGGTDVSSRVPQASTEFEDLMS